ncbi:endonuclease/exonuclease/phosphatase family protein [Candidatus Gracilibacteria bacterium]|nr:endonuclease/exonuclease/phosphatase family protein [Candidatus Gracilibacteria bacterium]
MHASRWSQHALTIVFIIVGIAAVGAWLGPLHWLGDILALVIDYYFLLAGLLLLLALWQRRWRAVGLAATILVLTSVQLTSHPRVTPAALPQGARELRVLVYNIYYLNEDLDAVVASVKASDADIVFLMEYSEAIHEQIGAAFADYPYQLIRPSRFTMGLALLSRLPFEATEVHRNEETRIPIYEVRMRLNGDPFTLVGGHPWPPQLRWGALHRSQMAAISQVAAQATAPRLIVGDFNAVPWSYTIRQLVEQADVLPIRQPVDLTKTWRPLPFFGLPVDHVLVSPEWQVLVQSYGAPGGSDHVPMIVDLALN